MSNRHGLISGATGTGKTVTLQTLAESFSRAGIPVFVADIKGDLSGLGKADSLHPKIDERLKQIPLSSFQQRPYPVVFWNIFGKELRNEYGNISSASIGAIQRRLLILEEQGAEHFFGDRP